MPPPEEDPPRRGTEMGETLGADPAAGFNALIEPGIATWVRSLTSDQGAVFPSGVAALRHWMRIAICFVVVERLSMV